MPKASPLRSWKSRIASPIGAAAGSARAGPRALSSSVLDWLSSRCSSTLTLVALPSFRRGAGGPVRAVTTTRRALILGSDWASPVQGETPPVVLGSRVIRSAASASGQNDDGLRLGDRRPP